MARPVLLAVDDDPGVLRAAERDLRRHYGDDDHVVGATALALVPEELVDLHGAPLTCASVTTFNALRNSGARPGELRRWLDARFLLMQGRRPTRP